MPLHAPSRLATLPCERAPRVGEHGHGAREARRGERAGEWQDDAHPRAAAAATPPGGVRARAHRTHTHTAGQATHDLLDHLDGVVRGRHEAHARRVVAAVLEALQAIDEDLHRLPVAAARTGAAGGGRLRAGGPVVSCGAAAFCVCVAVCTAGTSQPRESGAYHGATPCACRGALSHVRDDAAHGGCARSGCVCGAPEPWPLDDERCEKCEWPERVILCAGWAECAVGGGGGMTRSTLGGARDAL
jgi:hypothetical protein